MTSDQFVRGSARRKSASYLGSSCNLTGCERGGRRDRRLRDSRHRLTLDSRRFGDVLAGSGSHSDCARARDGRRAHCTTLGERHTSTWNESGGEVSTPEIVVAQGDDTGTVPISASEIRYRIALSLSE